MHLAVAAIVLDVNDTGDMERDEPDHLGPAQEAGAKRTTAGDLVLLSAVDNCALDGRREAVLQYFEDDARRCRTDAVNARQDASIEQIGQRTFESPYRGRRALVAPAALGRALDRGEVTKRRADDAVDVDERPPLTYPSGGTIVESIERRTKNIPGAWATRARIAAKEIAPALERQLADLQAQRAIATGDATMWARPNGEEYYWWALKASTTTTMSPDESVRTVRASQR
jgi:hypothetical protein